MPTLLAVILVGFLAVAGLPPRASAQAGTDGQSRPASPFEKGRLGAELQELTAETVKGLRLTQAHAVLIVLPTPGGPAERAGLLTGDVIVEVEGAPVGDLKDLIGAIQGRGAGRALTLGILRGNARMTVAATLEKLADAPGAPTDPAQKQAAHDRLVAARKSTLQRFDRASFPQEWAQTQYALGQAYWNLNDGKLDDPEPAIAAYEAALTVLTRDTDPDKWARAKNDLADFYRTRRVGDRTDNLEKAIAAYEASLTVYTRDAEPGIWAETQNNLALVYRDRIRGDRAENLENAIAAYEASLAVFTPETEPQRRAVVKGNLGNTYKDRIRGDLASNLETAIAAYDEALALYRSEGLTQQAAGVQNNLCLAYTSRILGDRTSNLETAIAACEASLAVFSRDTHPDGWARAQSSLARAYWKRVRGDRADNLEKAIAAYEAAATVYTREAAPETWAKLQSDLAGIHTDRIRGDRADNLEKAVEAREAALTILTREAAPRVWALVQMNLAISYNTRIRGDRAENQEKAIAGHQAALAVWTREADPRDWATVQLNLCAVYEDRIRGDRADNQERAIAACEAGLAVYIREALPAEAAQARLNLGHAYAGRIRGDRADNQETAIAHYEAAVEVLARDGTPDERAAALNDLGNGYQKRVRGDRADSIEKAIAAFEAALSIATHETLPRQWAMAQNNLALAYGNRIRGDRAENQEKEIAIYEAMLSVLSHEALPSDRALWQTNLAVAYALRTRGDRAANLKKAVAAAEAALSVRTLDADPLEYLRSTRTLGFAASEMRDWERASSVYAGARDAFRLLFGQGLNDAQARNLVSFIGTMYAEAAYAAAQRGQAATALALASEGRAQLMAAALRLQTLDLPDDKRRRLEELRAAIRTAERTIEATQVAERAAAAEKLVALRQELIGLVKDADASVREDALAQARALAGRSGAVVVPIVTKLGGKLLIVSSGVRPSGPPGSDAVTQPEPQPQRRAPIAVIDLPELTTARLSQLMRGDGKPGGDGGWLGPYNINYLEGVELDRRWPEWLAAVERLGPELWSLFGARLDAALRQRGIGRGARIVWLPTGALGILPLGLARDPAGRQRLADRYEIVYAPSLEALAAARKQVADRAPATLAVVVNPTGDLPGTEKEGMAVASHFPATARTVLVRSAATPDAVLAALKGRTHWHFASHGAFSWDDARQSALLMHGTERLSVGRLLETHGMGRPRLVVLSACETGLHGIDRDPDEFIGLPGTFTALGAAGVLGTLWPVSDAATALLMAKFYELHMEAKQSPPTALRRAQTWLRRATNADLQAYARAAAKQGRLEVRHVAEIEHELSDEGQTRSAHAAAIAPDAARAQHGMTSGRADRLARPYAHPYFWSGFIYTGL